MTLLLLKLFGLLVVLLFIPFVGWLCFESDEK